MNKKGFTLVELLAVIVILAIIALIVTPVVGNIITSARMAANARSVEGHIRNVELVIMTKAFNEETGDLTAYDSEGSSLLPSIQASLPNNDDVVCSSYMIENGTVTMALGCISERENWKELYSYTNVTGAEIIREFKGTLVSTETNDTHKGIIYLDPTDLNRVCDSDSTLTSTNVGCKKFYIFDDEGSTYKMIMDRDMGAKIAWVTKSDFIEAGGTEEEWGTSGSNSKGPVTALKELRRITTNWIGNPRMIEADEVAHIVGADSEDTIKWDSSKPYISSTGSIDTTTYNSWFWLDGGINSSNTTYSQNDGWQKQYATSKGTSNYAWLYDYTLDCENYGCNIAVNSPTYFTSTPVIGHQSLNWVVSRWGRLTTFECADEVFSIRPVIELPKALFNS